MRPQPIDYVYTHPRPACTNCPAVFAHNQDAVRYTAWPLQAFTIAMTGSHILVRSGMTLDDASYTQLTLIGVGFGILSALYATIYQDDFNRKNFLIRSSVGCFIGVVGIGFGMAFWATYLYPVTFIHLYGVASFTLNFISSDYFAEKYL